MSCADKITESGRKDTRGAAIDWLLLKKIFEGLAGIERARRSGGFGDGSLLRGLGVSCRRGVFFHGGAKFVKRAGVFAVFGRNAIGDGLRTFKLGAGIEKAALLAAMEFELALGTLAVGVEAGGEDGAAVGAARAGDGADHARGARAEMIVLAARAALRRLFVLMTMLFFVLLFAIAIAAMAILTVHVRLRLTVRAGGNY